MLPGLGPGCAVRLLGPASSTNTNSPSLCPALEDWLLLTYTALLRLSSRTPAAHAVRVWSSIEDHLRLQSLLRLPQLLLYEAVGTLGVVLGGRHCEIAAGWGSTECIWRPSHGTAHAIGCFRSRALPGTDAQDEQLRLHHRISLKQRARCQPTSTASYPTRSGVSFGASARISRTQNGCRHCSGLDFLYQLGSSMVITADAGNCPSAPHL